MSIGITSTSASVRGRTRYRIGPNPIVRSASISSDTFIEPSSAAKAAPERPQTMMAVISGPSSRHDREADQVRDEDVGAELLELHRALEGHHEADQEVDEKDDGHRVRAGPLHLRNLFPIGGARLTKQAEKGENHV